MPSEAQSGTVSQQLTPQLFEVVDLAIEDQRVSTAGRRHRLMPVFRQVKDSEATEPECHAAGGINPMALVVWATMLQRMRHLPDARAQIVCAGRALSIHKSGESTHFVSSL